MLKPVQHQKILLVASNGGEEEYEGIQIKALLSVLIPIRASEMIFFQIICGLVSLAL